MLTPTPPSSTTCPRSATAPSTGETADSRENAGLAWLTAAATAGEIHTMRVSFADRLGAWRGKRIPAGRFLADPRRPLSFCDGMIVCDVQCGVYESVPFSNYSTGYPDLYVVPELDRIHRVAWVPDEAYVFGVPTDQHGRPLPVAPAEVLRQAVSRLQVAAGDVKVGIALSGRLMRSRSEPVPVGEAWDADSRWSSVGAAAAALQDSGVQVEAVRAGPEPGTFTLQIAAGAAYDAALAAVVTKSALKETARQRGLEATFMTRPPGSSAVSRLTVSAKLPAGEIPPDMTERLAVVADVARPLLQPSVNAFKAGQPVIAVEDQLGHLTVELATSSEADPATTIAVLLTGIGAALKQDLAPPLPHGEVTPGRDFTGSVERLGRSSWAAQQLGEPFVSNSVALLREEAALFRAAVTDWEVARYWEAS